MSISPFDDFRVLFKTLPEKDKFSVILVKKNINELIFPNSSLQKNTLGAFEPILYWLAAWRGYENMLIKKPSIALFAGSQAIYDNSAMVKNFVLNLQSGGGFINELCQYFNILLRIYDLALDYPIMDIRDKDSIDEKSAAATMAFGLEAIAGDIDILGISSINIENQELNEACIAQILLGGELEEYLCSEHSQELIIKLKNKLANFECKDSFKILQKFGTREMFAICGAILAARMEKIPVILEGYTALLCAALLKNIQINAIDHCVIGQMPDKNYYHILQKFIDIPIIMNLNMDNNCGAGLAFAISSLKTTVSSFFKLHSFQDSIKFTTN